MKSLQPRDVGSLFVWRLGRVLSVISICRPVTGRPAGKEGKTRGKGGEGKGEKEKR